MKVKDIIERLQQFDPEMDGIIFNEEEMESYYLLIRRISTGYISTDSEELYFDPEDAIENEGENWSGELEEVVCFRT